MVTFILEGTWVAAVLKSLDDSNEEEEWACSTGTYRPYKDNEKGHMVVLGSGHDLSAIKAKFHLSGSLYFSVEETVKEENTTYIFSRGRVMP